MTLKGPGFNTALYRRLDARARRGIQAASVCILINIVLAGIKIATGVIGRTYVLIADGVESIMDVVSSLAVIGGFRIGARPPDANHPFGHGRAEALAGFFVSFLVTGAGIFIGVNSLKEILAPQQTPEAFTLGVLVIVVIVKEGMFRMLARMGRKEGNLALEADAWHSRSDALTSAAAFVGIGLTLTAGPHFAAADDWAALFASGVILVNGLRLLRVTGGELMDEDRVEADLPGRIRRLSEGVPGVAGTETCRLRRSGRGYFAELHIEVDGRLSVAEGHEIAHRVKDRLFSGDLHLIDIVVHVEPFRGGGRSDAV